MTKMITIRILIAVALAMLLSAPSAQAVTVVTDCSASGPAFVQNKITRLELPGEDIVVQCALMALPGSDQTRIVGASITIDGPNGGAVSSSGKGGQATSLTASGDITIDAASVVAADSNANTRVTAGGNILITGGSSLAAGDNVEITCAGPLCTIDIAATTISGNRVTIEGDGTVTISPASTILTDCPRDLIRIVSFNGDVLAGGGQLGAQAGAGALGPICCTAVQAVCSQNPQDPACPFAQGGTIVLNDLQELSAFCADCQQQPNLIRTCVEGDIEILAPQGNVDVSNATLNAGEGVVITALSNVNLENASINNCGKKRGVIVITGQSCSLDGVTILDDDPETMPALLCGVESGTPALLGTCAAN